MGIPIFLQFALLLAVQTAYAWTYIHTPWLRTAVVVPTVFRLAAWTLPACGMVMACGANPIDFFKLRDNIRKGLAWGVVIGLGFVMATLAQAWGVRGHARINLNFGLHLWIPSVLLVGFSEEVVFRGYFLRRLAERNRFWMANLAQALMFAGIHVPGWILMGHFGVSEYVYVLGFGLVLGYVLKKTDSLWACMLIHSFNNFAGLAIPV